MPFIQKDLPQYHYADDDGLLGLRGAMYYFQNIHTWHLCSVGKGNDVLPQKYEAGWIYTRYHVVLKQKIAASNASLIPDELIEAARLDGCNEFMILARIILPLSGAALSSLAIFTFRWQWNDYLAPLICLNEKMLFPLTIALAQFRMENMTLYTLIMAGSVISLIPVVVLFMFTQKYLIEGITMSGLKG